MRTITSTRPGEPVGYSASHLPGVPFTTRRSPAEWHADLGYTLLPPEPDADRPDALTAEVAALTARLDALEQTPAEAEPTPDVPRDCTGRAVEQDQLVAYGDSVFSVTKDLTPICMIAGKTDGWSAGSEASFIAADWAECRILWPLDERTEGKR